MQVENDKKLLSAAYYDDVIELKNSLWQYSDEPIGAIVTNSYGDVVNTFNAIKVAILKRRFALFTLTAVFLAVLPFIPAILTGLIVFSFIIALLFGASPRFFKIFGHVFFYFSSTTTMSIFRDKNVSELLSKNLIVQAQLHEIANKYNLNLSQAIEDNLSVGDFLSFAFDQRAKEQKEDTAHIFMKLFYATVGYVLVGVAENIAIQYLDRIAIYTVQIIGYGVVAYLFFNAFEAVGPLLKKLYEKFGEGFLKSRAKNIFETDILRNDIKVKTNQYIDVGGIIDRMSDKTIDLSKIETIWLAKQLSVVLICLYIIDYLGRKDFSIFLALPFFATAAYFVFETVKVFSPRIGMKLINVSLKFKIGSGVFGLFKAMSVGESFNYEDVYRSSNIAADRISRGDVKTELTREDADEVWFELNYGIPREFKIHSYERFLELQKHVSGDAKFQEAFRKIETIVIPS
ncbi:hypothetical protein [Sulfuricurvum sp.]|uniref:hypothetical protein n=1 Tax=Sulfuricurvum sp. TaxID=2025608 RepID=UPI003BB624E5